jgi:hypothetical protein
MPSVLEDIPKDQYEIYFSHQCDQRPFNRGAMKNIGFLAMKNKYPNDYKNITFVFNDIDTVPYRKNLLQYETTLGNIKHFYGYEFALGGIISIKGADFEKINGFPSYWSWGFEDNCLQNRAKNKGLYIDRSNFFKIGNPNILQLMDGIRRMINRKGPHALHHDNGNDGLSGITHLQYNIENYMINVYSFQTLHKEEDEIFENYDLSTKKIMTNNFANKLANGNQIVTEKKMNNKISANINSMNINNNKLNMLNGGNQSLMKQFNPNTRSIIHKNMNHLFF